MKKFSLAMLALVLVSAFAVGLAFVGCDNGTTGSDYGPRTIRTLFDKVKSFNVGNLWAYAFDWQNDINNRIIQYCFDHQAWEPYVDGVGSTHGAPPTFPFADAIAIRGNFFATEESSDVSLAARLISVLEAFYADEFKTATAPTRLTSVPDGTSLFAWYYFEFSKGSGSFGASARATQAPLMVSSYYLFDRHSNTSNETTLGLSFSVKYLGEDFEGGEVISYVLNHTYSEALGILTGRLGQPAQQGQIGLQGGSPEFILGTRSWVVFEDCIGLNQYRLLYGNANGDWGGAWWWKQ